MNLNDIIKHSVLGTAAFVIASKPINSAIDSSSLPESDKIRYKAATIGAIGSGILGYFIVEKVDNNITPISNDEKIRGVLIGTIGGGITGYVICEKLMSQYKNKGGI